jgi:hypothetical protein
MNVKNQLPLLQWAEESRISIKHFIECLEREGYCEPLDLITTADLIKVFMNLEKPDLFLKCTLPKITGLYFDEIEEGIWKKSCIQGK